MGEGFQGVAGRFTAGAGGGNAVGLRLVSGSEDERSNWLHQSCIKCTVTVTPVMHKVHCHRNQRPARAARGRAHRQSRRQDGGPWVRDFDGTRQGEPGSGAGGDA